MWLIDRLAEAHIRQAQEQGAFEDLPGAGRPLTLDDDSLVPEHLRAGYRLLKNAGFLPPELLLQREIREAEDLLAQMDDGEERTRARRRLEWLRLQLAQLRGDRPLHLDPRYRERVMARLEGEDGHG